MNVFQSYPLSDIVVQGVGNSHLLSIFYLILPLENSHQFQMKCCYTYVVENLHGDLTIMFTTSNGQDTPRRLQPLADYTMSLSIRC